MDVPGRVYEYFPGKFASAEGLGGNAGRGAHRCLHFTLGC